MGVTLLRCLPRADGVYAGGRHNTRGKKRPSLPFLPSTAVDIGVSSDCLRSKRLAGGRWVGLCRLRLPFGRVQKTLEEIG
jgi:hypothetical protein